MEIIQKLTQEIRRAGSIPFSRFMHLALYAPEVGYYERDACQIGRAGDFFTSVAVGPLFGQLLGWQVAGRLAPYLPEAVQVVEAGAHDGTLAADILACLRRIEPGLFRRMKYLIVEPSARRQAKQRARLEEFAGQVRWVEELDQLVPGSIRGVVFANELLDAFPVRRFQWEAEAGQWRERAVGLDGSRLVWTRMGVDAEEVAWVFQDAGLELGGELLGVLPDGFTLDLCPEAGAWWERAAGLIASGTLFTIDYGLTALELLRPERTDGTLRAYWRHHLQPDPLARPGEQDLTAHVNFTQLQRAGESAGLRTEGLYFQDQFLTGLARRVWERSGQKWAGEELRQFRTLTHPDLLGRCFRVLIQSRPGQESS